MKCYSVHVCTMLQHGLRGERTPSSKSLFRASFTSRCARFWPGSDRLAETSKGGQRSTAVVEWPTHPLTHTLTHVTVLSSAPFFFTASSRETDFSAIPSPAPIFSADISWLVQITLVQMENSNMALKEPTAHGDLFNPT